MEREGEDEVERGGKGGEEEGGEGREELGERRRGKGGEGEGGEGRGGAGSVLHPLEFGFRRGNMGLFFVVYNLTGIWISGRSIICLVCFPGPVQPPRVRARLPGVGGSDGGKRPHKGYTPDSYSQESSFTYFIFILSIITFFFQQWRKLKGKSK